MSDKCLSSTDHLSSSFVRVRSVHSISLHDAFRYVEKVIGSAPLEFLIILGARSGKSLGQLAGRIQHSAQNAG